MDDVGDRAAAGHGLVPMILGCGLLLVAILALGFVGGWAAAVILGALLICPLMLLGLWRVAEQDQLRSPRRRERHEASR